MNIVLIGFKGVGKTTLGKKVAKRLQWSFIDMDDLVQQEYERLHLKREATHVIHQKLQEKGFRNLELKALESLKVGQQTVLATGGGTPLNTRSAQKLREWGRIFYLEGPKKAIKEMLLQNRIPTFLDANDPESSFEKMYQIRKPLYEALADETFQVDWKNEQELIDQICHKALDY